MTVDAVYAHISMVRRFKKSCPHYQADWNGVLKTLTPAWPALHTAFAYGWSGACLLQNSVLQLTKADKIHQVTWHRWGLEWHSSYNMRDQTARRRVPVAAARLEMTPDAGQVSPGGLPMASAAAAQWPLGAAEGCRCHDYRTRLVGSGGSIASPCAQTVSSCPLQPADAVDTTCHNDPPGFLSLGRPGTSHTVDASRMHRLGPVRKG